MRLLNFMKKDTKYLSWDEYKKRLVEMHILHLIDKFAKSNLNYDYRSLEKDAKKELARFSQLWGKKWKKAFIQIKIGMN